MIRTAKREEGAMKKLYFGSNLKMYKGISATREYLQKLVENTKDIRKPEQDIHDISKDGSNRS